MTKVTFNGSLILPYDFTSLDNDASMKLCRTLIYNEVLQLRNDREKEEEKISAVRRFSSSAKVYKTIITKTQPNKPITDKDDKEKCTIISIVC